jgi:hypothetical protein
VSVLWRPVCKEVRLFPILQHVILFISSDLLSRHVNKCHADEKPPPNSGGSRRKGIAASRATTSKQACDQCVQSSLPCDGGCPCSMIFFSAVYLLFIHVHFQQNVFIEIANAHLSNFTAKQPPSVQATTPLQALYLTHIPSSPTHQPPLLSTPHPHQPAITYTPTPNHKMASSLGLPLVNRWLITCILPKWRSSRYIPSKRM